jgi:hypothetical protein
MIAFKISCHAFFELVTQIIHQHPQRIFKQPEFPRDAP